MKNFVLNHFCLEYIIVGVCAISFVCLFVNRDTPVSRFLTSVCSQDVMSAGPSLSPLAGLRFTPALLEVHAVQVTN